MPITRKMPARTALVVALVAAGACGPGAPPGETRALAPPSAPATSAPPPSTAPPSTALAEAPDAGAPPAPIPMRPIARSSMEDKLREIGVDPSALPPLAQLDAKTLRDVMNTFTKALGVSCKHCHDKDFRAPTENKKIAARMWNDYARGLTMNGGAVYCDSCHAGRSQLLDRGDLAALGAWMKANYVDGLARVDGKEHGCPSCHGDPFEGKILTTLWK